MDRCHRPSLSRLDCFAPDRTGRAIMGIQEQLMSGKQKQSGVVDGSGSSDEIQRCTAPRKAAAALAIIKGNRNIHSARRVLPNPTCQRSG